MTRSASDPGFGIVAAGAPASRKRGADTNFVARSPRLNGRSCLTRLGFQGKRAKPMTGDLLAQEYWGKRGRD